MLTAQSTLPLQKESTDKRKQMPYKSEKQRGFFNANRKKMEGQGVNVDEWNQASKGKQLPARAPKKKTFGQRIAEKD